jgi:hypothetical protein
MAVRDLAAPVACLKSLSLRGSSDYLADSEPEGDVKPMAGSNVLKFEAKSCGNNYANIEMIK